MSSEKLSLQKEFAPNSICFGCGPANKEGLQIASHPEGDFLVATFSPAPHHQAFPGMINGGIIGTLLDCHCNWTAAWTIKKLRQTTHMPCTVTAEYQIKLRRPTPAGVPLKLKAHAVEVIAPDRVWVEGELIAGEKVTATCRGLFVAVEEGHPAYHRWG